MVRCDKTDLGYILIFSGILVFSTFLNFTTSPAFLYDEAGFLLAAREVAAAPLLGIFNAKGIAVSLVGSNTTFLVASGLFFKLFGASLWTARFFSTLCGLLLSLCVYFFVKRHRPADAAFVSALIVATAPPILAHSRIYSQPIFSTLLVVLAVFSFVEGEKKSSLAPAAFAGTLLAFACLNRITHLASFAFICLFVILRDGAKRALHNVRLWTAGVSLFAVFSLVAMATGFRIFASGGGGAFTPTDMTKVLYLFMAGNPLTALLQNVGELLFGFHSEYGVYYIIPHLFLIPLAFVAFRRQHTGTWKLFLSSWFFFFLVLYLISSGLFRNYMVMVVPAAILVSDYLCNLLKTARTRAYVFLFLLFVSTLALLSFFALYSNDAAFQVVDYLHALPPASRIGTSNPLICAISEYPFIPEDALLVDNLDYYVPFEATEPKQGAFAAYLQTHCDVAFEARYVPKGLAANIFNLLSFESIRREPEIVCAVHKVPLK